MCNDALLTSALDTSSACWVQVAGLLTFEELDSMLAPLKDRMASQAMPGQELYTYFQSQVQRNLRIAISMDPSKPEFEASCLANPALFSR